MLCLYDRDLKMLCLYDRDLKMLCLYNRDLKDAMPVLFRSDLFTSYSLTIFKQ